MQKELSLNRDQYTFLELFIKRRKDTDCNMDTVIDALNTLDDDNQEFNIKDAVLVYQKFTVNICFAPQYEHFMARAIRDIESSGHSAQFLREYHNKNNARNAGN